MGEIMLFAAACLVFFTAKMLNERFWERWFRKPLFLLIVGSIMCLISLKSISPEAIIFSPLAFLTGLFWLIVGGLKRLHWHKI